MNTMIQLLFIFSLFQDQFCLTNSFSELETYNIFNYQQIYNKQQIHSNVDIHSEFSQNNSLFDSELKRNYRNAHSNFINQNYINPKYSTYEYYLNKTNEIESLLSITTMEPSLSLSIEMEQKIIEYKLKPRDNYDFYYKLPETQPHSVYFYKNNQSFIVKEVTNRITRKCLIIDLVQNSYMYAANLFFSSAFRRLPYSWDLGYLDTNTFTTYDLKGVWDIIPVQNMSSVYYIRNNFYENDYLYLADASYSFVFLSKSYNHLELPSNYMWIIKQNKNSFISIQNYKYKMFINGLPCLSVCERGDIIFTAYRTLWKLRCSE